MCRLSSRLLTAYSSASLIRLAPRPAVRVVASLCLVSTPHSVSRLISSAHPARSRLARRLALLALPVSRVGGRGVPHLALISSCVLPVAPLRACLPSCVPLILGVRLRMSSPCLPPGVLLRMPSPRSCVPLLPFRLRPVSLHRPVPRVDKRGDVGRFSRC